MRNFDPNIAAEIEKESLRFFFLLEIQGAETYRFNDIDIPIFHGGELFACRSFSFDQLSGSANLSVESLDIEIDDADQVISALVLGEDVRNKIAILYFGVIAAEASAGPLIGYASAYPPAQSDTYVKATSKTDTDHWAYHATDPAKSLTGLDSNGWASAINSPTNQRVHIDAGRAIVPARIYYENFHHNGGNTDAGAKTFTLWGSNDAGSFADLTYGNDTGWTQLTTSQATLDEHAAANAADPKYITVTGSAAYRYFALKIADNWGDGTLMGLRRIEVQEAVYSSTKIHIQELMRGIIGGWDIYGDSKVKLNVTNEMILWNKKSLRPQSSSCPWTFKGVECAYAGAETWCDQSYARCVDLLNAAQFGGERFLPAITEREIWWGRQRGA